MRSRRRIASGLLVASALALAACVDLFHSTSFENACDLDAAACLGSVAEASALAPDGATDFCAWSAAVARTTAIRACAWLGACAGPAGDAAFGPCLLQATLAYDCAANPDRPALGAVHDFWAKLAEAQSCADVTNAILPPGIAAQCGSSATAYSACLGDDAGALVLCGAGPDDGGSAGAGVIESCAASGQTCAASGTSAACAGASSACDDAGLWCDGTRLHDCEPGATPFDQGVDCADFGSGSCSSAGPACTTLGAPCTPTPVVACDGNVASGCPSGFQETIDCAALLAPTVGPATGATPACDPSGAGRPWDVSRACVSGGGSCTSAPDACNADGSIDVCAHGAIFTVPCSSLGFAGCRLERVPGDAAPHAACVPP